MNKEELKARLSSEGFRRDVYSVDGPLPSYEGFILVQQGSSWIIEHFERGQRRTLERYDSEEAACDAMYALLSAAFRK